MSIAEGGVEVGGARLDTLLWPAAVTCALRIAYRELRGGVRGFRVFLACLLLGVGAVAAIGSLGAAVEAGLRGEARSLLGGDVSAELAGRPANDAERVFLHSRGTLSETVELRAMARSLDGAQHSLIQLQAVDDAYPLYGTVTLSPAEPLQRAIGASGGIFGAIAEPALANRLGLAIGDRFRVGGAELRLTATVERLPDAALHRFALGPRVIVSPAALAATALVQPGSLINYEYRVRLPAEVDAAHWIADARMQFPEAGWQLRSSADASPSLQHLFHRVAFFLELVGVTALLIGGVGIGNAVAAYLAGKVPAIATLKCLGASGRLVFATYLLQVLVMAGLGITGGLAFGAATPWLIAMLIGRFLPLPLPVAIYPAPLAIAALCGLLVTLLFSLWPLAATLRVTPAVLWRERVEPPPRRSSWLAAGATAAAALVLAAMIVWTAPDRRVGLWYVGGIAAAFLLLRGAGWLITRAARAAPRPRRPLLRLALGNLHRPGAPTARVVLSFGLGLSLLVAVALVEGNLAAEIDVRLAERAPADFFIDIQPDQRAGFEALLRAAPGVTFEEVPMLRGRIIRLAGTPVEQARIAPEARWAVRGDRGLTYSAALPAGSRLAAGSWWPADYKGAPLVSFDAGLARGMGLKVGDTLTVNVLGRDITATIANLRDVDWTGLGINFAIVFAPGTLEAAPQTRLAAIYAPPAEADRIVRQVTEQYPNVSAIDVRQALAEVARAIAAIGSAIRIVAALTMAVGTVVLAGAIAAEHRRRIYDAVLLKVLGATRRDIAVAFTIEHLLLAMATVVVAAAIGTLAAWAVVTGPMKTDWLFLPGPPLVAAAGGVLLTLLLGFAGTWRALATKPARHLRRE